MIRPEDIKPGATLKSHNKRTAVIIKLKLSSLFTYYFTDSHESGVYYDAVTLAGVLSNWGWTK